MKQHPKQSTDEALKKECPDPADRLTRLPDAEYEVMYAIWNTKPPITTAILMKQLGNSKGWKPQTLISLLNRLIHREFLRTEKSGKERFYYPIITNEAYIQFETNYFVKHYHNNSIINLVNAFSKNSDLSREDIEDLNSWLKTMEED